MKTILVVEDDRDFYLAVESELQKHGFGVILTDRGEHVGSLLQKHKPDLILLDVMLPGKSGFDVCREIRVARPRLPIIMMTASMTEECHRVEGLDLGADDYLVKPFGTRELIARVNACLRRANAAREDAEQLAFEDLSIDLSARAVRRAGMVVPLTAREFDLLQYLARHSGRFVSREELSREVFRNADEVSTRTMDTHILNLRGKLEANPKRPAHLLSKINAGYTLV